MDISHGIPFASPMKIYAGDYDDVADAAIVILNTNQGIYRKQLNLGQERATDFCLCDGEQVEEVYAYCNLHGLWKC